MHITVDDINFYDGLECVYVKYKSRALTASGLRHVFLPVKTWLLIACNTAFYAIISNVQDSGNFELSFMHLFWFYCDLCM